MRVIIYKLILLFSISTFSAVHSIAQNQNLQLTYQYSLCDVYYIQDKNTNNTSCITTSTKTGGEAGYTKYNYEYSSEYYIDGQGVRQAIPIKTKRAEEVPSNEYSYRVFTNTCTEYALVKAIRKIRLTTGQTMYEDASFWVKPGETEQKKNIKKYVDDYDSQTAGIGSVIAYKNALNINADTYYTYVNSVINSDRGTLIVTPTSTKTRIYLNSGDKLIIKAGGSIRLGMFAGYSGPDGINGFSSYNMTPNANHGALIYYFTGTDW